VLGTSVSEFPVTRTPTLAMWAMPPPAGWAALAVLAACGRVPLGGVATGAAESHMEAVSVWKTAVPALSVAWAPPSAVPVTVTPLVEMPWRSARSAGLPAAARVRTMRVSLYPLALAVSCRSVPGSTFR
jgi:hypothetical protein